MNEEKVSILLVDDLFTRQVAGMLGTPATSLQPVLMRARDRKILSAEQYAKAITDLADMGQEFISIDPPILAFSRKLDRESGEEGIGRRFRAARLSMLFAARKWSMCGRAAAMPAASGS